MKRCYIFIFVFMLFISLFFNVNEVYANGVVSDYSVSLLDNDSEEICTGLLGEPLKKDLESVMSIIRIAGPLIVIFLTTMEFIGAITSKDDDALKKCTNKLVIRLVLVAILFLLPTLLNLLLKFLDQKYTTCIR